MNKVTIEIDNCDDCPKFNNSHWDYKQYCNELEREIEETESVETFTFFPIPDDCPLLKALNESK